MPALVSPGISPGLAPTPGAPNPDVPNAGPAIRPDELLIPLAPVEAYAADVARLGGRAPLSAVDDAWLALAHTLARAAMLPAAQRGPVCIAGARTARAVLPESGVEVLRIATAAAADSLLTLAGHLAGWKAGEGDAGEVGTAVSALQVVVAQQEQAGAFLLAFSMLAAVREALGPVLGAREKGLLLTQQGRVARQLGALTSASHLYRVAARTARMAGIPDIRARALLGRGVLANMRGNYPEARVLFKRALSAAARARSVELRRAAHQGLLIAAFAASDVDTALAHGWAAVRVLPSEATEERAEMLVNLGEIGRQAGEYRAALGACLSALELTNLPRIRLPALGTAAQAAARSNERRLLLFIGRDIERTISRSGQAFENARALMHMAEAYAALGDDRALKYVERAEALASVGHYHEVAACAEDVRRSLEAHGAAGSHVAVSRTWSERTKAVLRSLESLPAANQYAMEAAC